ncbi:hypothetical protein ACJX0J_008665, partial [Zea mays]
RLFTFRYARGIIISTSLSFHRRRRLFLTFFLLCALRNLFWEVDYWVHTAFHFSSTCIFFPFISWALYVANFQKLSSQRVMQVLDPNKLTHNLSIISYLTNCVGYVIRFFSRQNIYVIYITKIHLVKNKPFALLTSYSQFFPMDINLLFSPAPDRFCVLAHYCVEAGQFLFFVLMHNTY